ncbi:MAG: DMT family transporter [Hahellaceae bacterium]|nr:DMT family transporter [Hahellaceae bacterium]MCP5211482.1 DMT family transporter [Hahellaceae bacterium]
MLSFFAQIPLGVRYMVLSAFGFSIMAVCVKLASSSGLPVLEIVAARALVSLVLSYLDIKRKGISLVGQRKGLLLARGVVGALALVCVYYALTVLPLAEATVLQYLHPMFTAVLALIFLRERIQLATMLCIVFSFAGLIVIAQPASLFAGTPSTSMPPLALAAAILGALGSAIAYVLVRKLSQTEDPSVIIFYFPLVALPLAALGLGTDFVMPTGWEWLILLMVGVFTQVGQIGLTKAMQTETAGKATAFSYLQVVFAAILGWLIFAEIPQLWTWVGGGLILGGALINLLLKK